MACGKRSASCNHLNKASLKNDASVFLGPGVTIANYYQDGGTAVVNGPITNVESRQGTMQIFDSATTAATIASLVMTGGTVFHNGTGLVIVCYVGTGSIYDRSQEAKPCHFGNVYLYGKSTFVDPHRAVIFDNPYQLVNCGYQDIALDLGRNLSATRTPL